MKKQSMKAIVAELRKAGWSERDIRIFRWESARMREALVLHPILPDGWYVLDARGKPRKIRDR
jgi:hypothetical protein